MRRVLIISVRFHDGRYHGAGPWPPSPARLFQALVAGAALHGLDTHKREALKWLERLNPPAIAAPTARRGQNVRLYVPNNDLDSIGGDIRRIAEIRTDKPVRPCLFDVAVPLLYLWRFDDEEDRHVEDICKIADELYQLGRGVDMAWAVGEIVEETVAEKQLNDYRGVVYLPGHWGNGLKLDCPAEGSLDSLQRRYEAYAKRFQHFQGGKQVRTHFTNPPKAHFRSVDYNCPATYLLFDLRRTAAPGSPFAPWPLRDASTLVQSIRGGVDKDGTPVSGAAKRLYDSLPSKQREIKRVLIGRNATEADKAQRIRIIPLPSIGHPHADRSIRRVLVEVPPNCPIRADDLDWGFHGLEVASAVHTEETREIPCSPVELVRANHHSMLEHYGIGAANVWRLWRSVTPLALPQTAAESRIVYEKQNEEGKNAQKRLVEQRRAGHKVRQTLRHAGIRARIAAIRVQREPFDSKGERAEAFASGDRFLPHRLWHVEIEFAHPVEGPLVLGDGRYLGLGVMAPVPAPPGILAYKIEDGLTGNWNESTALAVAQALRRATMARVQDRLGEDRSLPPFFTGHSPNGAPLRPGDHRHLAFAADLARQRLLIITPHLLEGREPDAEEKKYLRLLDEAMHDLEFLTAGRAGLLKLQPHTVDLQNDCLLGSFRCWVSETSYRPTRYVKRLTPEEALQADLQTELVRRRLPRPHIETLSVRRGVRGSLAGKFRLLFPNAIQGPLILGQNQHLGGGLFAADDLAVATADKPQPNRVYPVSTNNR